MLMAGEQMENSPQKNGKFAFSKCLGNFAWCPHEARLGSNGQYGRVLGALNDFLASIEKLMVASSCSSKCVCCRRCRLLLYVSRSSVGLHNLARHGRWHQRTVSSIKIRDCLSLKIHTYRQKVGEKIQLGIIIYKYEEANIANEKKGRVIIESA